MTCLSICGDSGAGKSLLADLLAKKLGNTTILEGDRYHKWSRNHPNWLRYTQLNPECNYIDAMNKDVETLKSGSSIFCPNYDHTKGEFTKIQEIKPTQNLIACGLHTFICPDGLYDLKIFVNADKALKMEWKIARDTASRGYTLEQVMHQIERRQADYESFIAPLVSDADVMVRFYRNDVGEINVNVITGLGKIAQFSNDGRYCDYILSLL